MPQRPWVGLLPPGFELGAVYLGDSVGGTQAVKGGAGFIEAALHLARLVKKADVLIPLAAVVGAPACKRAPWLARSVNLEAVRLLNRLRSPRQLVIFPTTNSGYGTQSGEVYCTGRCAGWWSA